MLKITYSMGLRLSEIVNLKWKHVDLNSGRVMIKESKGAKDRGNYLPPEDINLLRKWRQRQVDEITANPEYVFTTLKGTKIHPRYIQDMVKRYAGKAGIEKNISPHTLRHTIATDMLEAGVNIRVVQEFLGHENVSTTQVYTHVAPLGVRDAVIKFHERRKNG